MGFLNQVKEQRRQGNMSRWGFLLAVLLLLVILVAGCGKGDSGKTDNPADAIQAAETQRPAQDMERKEKQTAKKSRYTRKDIDGLKGTENFAKGAVEHIFEGTINKKGKATGYHYSMVDGTKGHILEGTRSKVDANLVFTAKVEVGDVKKNGFSSFYPEEWSPQEVVDAINDAYKDALDNPDNPHGDLWIGHHGNLEIDMYLNDKKKILTAYPIYVENKK